MYRKTRLAALVIALGGLLIPGFSQRLSYMSGREKGKPEDRLSRKIPMPPLLPTPFRNRVGSANIATPTSTITVTSLQDGSPNAANCPGAGCRLGDAIVKAAAGDTINFSVTGTINLALGDPLPTISQNVTINGPGAGQLTIKQTTGNIFFISPNTTFAINNVTITGGNAANGAGIFNQGTTTVSDCIINGNTASVGGGIYNTGSMNISNSTISNNHASTAFSVIAKGGGIANVGLMTITGSTISNNFASSSGNGALGAGISNEGTLNINTSTISTNSGEIGGGLYVSGGAVTGSDNSFSGNKALGTNDGSANGSGAGIYVDTGNNSTLILDRSAITGNTSSKSGGGIFSNGNVTLTNSEVSSNIILINGFPGGGIFSHIGNLTLANSTVSGNTGRNTGGGIDCSGTVTLINDTISANTSMGNGGGLSNIGPVNIRNTIIAGNIATGVAPDVLNSVALTSLGNNLIGNNTGLNMTATTGDQIGTPSAPINPLLAPLGNYGGPIQTHALLPGSPAIDAGNNCVLTNICLSNNLGSNLTTDQRGTGFLRQVGSAVDIGAFESRGFTLNISSGNSQTAPVGGAFALPLAATVISINGEPVNGGTVTFTPPATGASCTIAGNPPSISGGVATSGTVTANSNGGTYTVLASTTGASANIGFSLTNQNSAPTFTPAAAIVRQQGSPAGASVTIGTVTDAQTAAGSLTVTQIAGGTATGVTASGITNTNGTITALLSASCGAVSGTVRFQVSDGSLTGAGDLQVNVSANTAPTLTYLAASVNSGSSTTVNPVTGPTDNGSIASIVVHSTGTYTGTISVNNSTGVVSISNAVPVGSHTITIRATDNCGATTDASFTLIVNSVNTPPTFTPAAALSRQQGSPSSAAVTVGTVSDTQTAAGSLTVTQIAGGTATGITVSSITNTSGTITAFLSASCGAASGTVRFQVSDGSLTSTGDLQVNVTANTVPTLTYFGVLVGIGGSATINPATGPADNGSIAGIVVHSTGTYTGTISANSSTGVVSISNAAPSGSHAITIRAIDNCGATTDTTLTLAVSSSSSAVSLTTSNSAIAVGQSVTFTATVSPVAPATGTPTGTVQFKDNGANLGSTVTLVGGVAMFQTSSLTAGEHTITAVYSGDSSFLNATSPNLTQIVSTGTCATPPSGLVDWWQAEGNANDQVGSNNGTLMLNATFATGLDGQAFSFNGTQGFVKLPDNFFPFPTSGTSQTPFTFEVWFKTTSGGGIFGQQDVSPYSTPGGYVPGVYVGTDGLLYAEMFWKGSQNPLVSSTTVNDGAFHHAAVVYDGTNQSLYIDGALIGSKAHTQTSYNATYKYQFGTSFTTGWVGGATGWFNFSGLIDEPSLYNRALSATEVQALFNARDKGKCVSANTNPTITPAASLTRQQGSPAGAAVMIATVSDAETPAGNLTVIATTVPTGITVTGITNTNGTISATVAAACNATVGSNTIVLTVTDGGGLTATGNLTVNVSANTGPPLTYAASSVASGGSTTVNPVTGPSDNGSIASIVVQSKGTYTGTISVDNLTGVVSISNAAPGGSHTITIRATDNCGATTDASFTLMVNTAPMFTPAAAINRQQGSPAGAAVTVGIVSDAQTSPGSLTVTQIAGGTATGITVSGITNTSGTTTAILGASCGAASGTVRFQVSDGSLTGTGDLQVNVGANTAPTLTYGAASANAGGSTTNSPVTANDNGSITGYTVQSKGTYSGTISVNVSGVVSISNATPAGNHTITIRATDNCGATTDASFTVTVSNPVINDLTPTSAQQGASNVILTINGSNFVAGSVVVVNDTNRTTSFVNSGQLTATLLSTDTATIGTDTVVVTNPGGGTSNQVLFTVNPSNVCNAQSASVLPGGNGNVQILPGICGPNGIKVDLNHMSAAVGNAIVYAATYTANPTGSSINDAGGGFMDLRITNSANGDSTNSIIYYPNTITGTNETNLKLYFHNGTNWQLVKSSGGGDPIKNTTDNQNGTISGGTFTVTINMTSTPKISDLTGTVISFSTVTPTAVEFDSAKVSAFGNATLIEWKTGMEVNNLGFNIYRDTGGERVKINPSIIAGTALIAGQNVPVQAGYNYHWVDETGNGGFSYWIEDIDLDGTSQWHGPFGVSASSSASVARARSMLLSELNANRQNTSLVQTGYPAGFSAASNANDFTGLLTNGRSPNKPAPISAALKKQWQIASQNAIKIAVNKTGWYKVSIFDLMTAGLTGKVIPANLQMFVGGVEIPIIVNTASPDVLTSNDSIEFYGTALDTPTTNTQIYWVVTGSQPGKRISTEQSPGLTNNTGPTSFQYTVERKDRTLYFSSLLNGDAENWFGPVVNTTPALQGLTVTHLDTGSSEIATIEIALQGVTTNAHQVNVMLNGNAIESISFNAMDHKDATLLIPQSSLVEGKNEISLVAQNSGDVSLVDFVRITYAHTYTADSNNLFAPAAGMQPVQVSGFTSDQIRAINVKNPNQPIEIEGTIGGDAGNYSIGFGPSKSRDLLLFTPDQTLRPASITANQPSGLNRAPGANFVVITYKDFVQSVQPFVSFKQSQGYKVTLVDVENIYDEFSYGVHKPQAVKDFLNWTYLHWPTQPQYVLLAGSGSLDPKNYTGLGDTDLVPVKLIDTSSLETASDDWFVDFNDDGQPQMSIGRLPVRNAPNASDLVGKIIDYEQSGNADTAVLVSDISDNADFSTPNAQLRAIIPSQMNVVSIVRGQTNTDARTELVDQLSQGGRIVNYAGHGSVNLWRGNLLTSSDATLFTNQKISPLLVTMTCLNAYFVDPRAASLGEALIRVQNGGPISVWASSAMTDTGNQGVLNRTFFQQIFGNPKITIGQAIREAKTATTDNDVRRTWILFGDPTMRIQK